MKTLTANKTVRAAAVLVGLLGLMTTSASAMHIAEGMLPVNWAIGWGAVCGAWMSPCRLAIAPLQDLLGLGADARVNAPGTSGALNWSWRVRREALNPDVSGRLARITRTYRR